MWNIRLTPPTGTHQSRFCAKPLGQPRASALSVTLLLWFHTFFPPPCALLLSPSHLYLTRSCSPPPGGGSVWIEMCKGELKRAVSVRTKPSKRVWRELIHLRRVWQRDGVTHSSPFQKSINAVITLYVIAERSGRLETSLRPALVSLKLVFESPFLVGSFFFFSVTFRC